MTTPARPAAALWMLALALLCLAGCRRGPAPGGWHLALSTSPATPVSMTETQFTLHVAAADGAPVTGATAALDLVMRSMDMGPNHVALADRGRGDYTGQGQFPMAGTWECRASVAVTGPKGRSQLQTFIVHVE